jgi:hypothetical protein
MLRATASASTWGVWTRTSAAVFTQLGSNFTTTGMTTTGPIGLDINVVYGSSGSITVYLGGTQVFTYSGNVTTDSATTLSGIEIAGMGAGTQNVTWSEVIVADSSTIAMGLWQMNSATAGNAQTWAGTASSVNKQTISDTTFISAASAGLINEYRSGGIALPAGAYTVPAIKMVARALVGATGPQNLEYVTRVGSTDYVGGSWGPPVGSFANDIANYMQATNPGTSAAWQTSDLTASTFNYGVESVT